MKARNAKIMNDRLMALESRGAMPERVPGKPPELYSPDENACFVIGANLNAFELNALRKNPEYRPRVLALLDIVVAAKKVPAEDFDGSPAARRWAYAHWELIEWAKQRIKDAKQVERDRIRSQHQPAINPDLWGK